MMKANSHSQLDIENSNNNDNNGSSDSSKIDVIINPQSNSSDSSALLQYEHLKLDHKLSQIHANVPTYNGTNPFVRKPLSIYEHAKIILFTLTGILVLRFMIFLMCALLTYIFAIFATLYKKDMNEPFEWYRRPFVYLIRLMIRIVLFAFGFYWINISHVNFVTSYYRDINNNNEENDTKKARIIVANHHTAFDGLILWYWFGGSAVVKSDIKHIPIVGRVAEAMQTVFIDRYSSEDKKLAIEKIKKIAQNSDLPPIIIFPQGTCSNIRTLTTFKPGAFIPGEPIQPVCLKFNNRFADLSFVGHSMLFEFVFAGSQFINFASMDILPSYYPNYNQKNNANLYANTIRSIISDHLHLEMTAHSLDDYTLLQIAHKKKSKQFLVSRIVMEDVFSILTMKTKTVSYLAEKFINIDQDKDGKIQYNDFNRIFLSNIKFLNLKKLFRLFNTKQKTVEEIEFEEFLAGIAVCYVDSMINDAIKIMFDTCNIGNNNKIKSTYLINILENSVPSSIINCNNQQFLQYFKNTFIPNIFVIASKNPEEEKEQDKEEIDFDTFKSRVLPLYHDVVQKFLQNVICAKLDVYLAKDDFVKPILEQPSVIEQITEANPLRDDSIINFNKENIVSNNDNVINEKNNNIIKRSTIHSDFDQLREYIIGVEESKDDNEDIRNNSNYEIASTSSRYYQYSPSIKIDESKAYGIDIQPETDTESEKRL